MSEYWHERDRKEVARARTYAELVPIALRVLSRMPQPVGELCGPISTGGAGSIEANLARFDTAIQRLREEGIAVFDLMPFEASLHAIRAERKKMEAFSGYDHALLEEFYLPVFESGFVHRFYMLPDWQSSTGASWEHEQALRLGIAVVYLADEY